MFFFQSLHVYNTYSPKHTLLSHLLVNQKIQHQLFSVVLAECLTSVLGLDRMCYFEDIIQEQTVLSTVMCYRCHRDTLIEYQIHQACSNLKKKYYLRNIKYSPCSIQLKKHEGETRMFLTRFVGKLIGNRCAFNTNPLF